MYAENAIGRFIKRPAVDIALRYVLIYGTDKVDMFLELRYSEKKIFKKIRAKTIDFLSFKNK